jgi:hypothetical protein
MTKTSFADRGALMSPRTAKYVEAIIREGDKFDFYKWLKGVREEGGQAKQVSTTSDSREAAQGQSGNRPSTFDNPDAPLRAAPTSMGNLLPLPQPTRQSTLKLRGNPKARLRRWLEKVCNAWGEFQASHARDARALRYAAIRKPPEMRLKAFMKGAGGVNACADRHAKYFGRGGR